jgi:hypothetical protein
MPGLSDHDIVYTEVNRIPAKIKQKPRKKLKSPAAIRTAFFMLVAWFILISNCL